jgi:hypothetical protein
MKDQCNSRKHLMVGGCMRFLLVLFLVAGFHVIDSHAKSGKGDACAKTAKLAQKACKNAANEAYAIALSRCENLPQADQKTCEEDARNQKADSLSECKDQLDARRDVCGELGGGTYDPQIAAITFVTPDNTNTYAPLGPRTYTYKSFDSTETIVETDVVRVIDETRVILGKTCRVILDTVYSGDISDINNPDPKLKREDTTDWYAQDGDGNVWYFGEISQQLEQDPNGGDAIVVGMEGSWTAGRDGAKPGYIMLIDPQPGDVYRQEFAPSEAEDMGRVIGTETLSDLKKTYPILVGRLPSDIADDAVILHTQDFSALEPGSVLEGQYEDKYYAPGVGVILTIANDGTGIQEVLVEITTQ